MWDDSLLTILPHRIMGHHYQVGDLSNKILPPLILLPYLSWLELCDVLHTRPYSVLVFFLENRIGWNFGLPKNFVLIMLALIDFLLFWIHKFYF